MGSCESQVNQITRQILQPFLSIHSRTVSYTADPKEGFKAEVVREPTDIVVKTPPPQTAEQLAKYQQAQYRPAAPAPKQSQPQYVQSQPQYRGQQQQRPDYSQYEQ